MIEKIKTIAKNPYWLNFKDIRYIGFLVFGILVLLASWSGVKVIETNYVLQKEIAQLDQQNSLKQLENSNLSLQNEFYKTDTFLELQARKSFSKGAPGETLVLVPRDVAYKYAPEIPGTEVNTEPKKKANDLPNYRRNFDAWMQFMFRRGS